MSLKDYFCELESGKYTHIIGADECGTGAWAGPAVVCACVVPITWVPPRGLNDSKKLRAAKREELYYLFRDQVPHRIEYAEVADIDTWGLGSAIKQAFVRAVTHLTALYPQALVVIDGELSLPDIQHLAFPKADGLVPAVSMASVLGKVTRDKLMVELGKTYLGYGLGKNAGYGTPDHILALSEKGPSAIHRKSYLPIQKLGGGSRFVEEPGVSFD